MITELKRVSVSEFKARCLALFDEVQATGVPIVVTKRGRPVARIEPVGDPPSLVGSVTFLVGDAELMAPLDTWDVETE